MFVNSSPVDNQKTALFGGGFLSVSTSGETECSVVTHEGFTHYTLFLFLACPE